MMEPLPEIITINDKYSKAMEITDSKIADEYFEVCVQHCMRFGKNREEAEAIERSNIGYFAGYFDRTTQVRVYKLFNCAHPIFGTKQPTLEEAFNAGLEMGRDRI